MLRVRTRCGICHRVGHWHRECPNKDKADVGKNSGSHEKEAHYLSRGPEFETSSEAYFCGLLDALPGDGPDDYILDFTKEMKSRRRAEEQLPNVTLGFLKFRPLSRKELQVLRFLNLFRKTCIHLQAAQQILDVSATQHIRECFRIVSF